MGWWSKYSSRTSHHGLDLYEFGETILYKLPGKGAAVAGRGNMAMNWEDGVFLGYRRDTLEYVIATADGVTSSRALMRRPTEQRWVPGNVGQITATPWEMVKKPEPTTTMAPAERH